MIPAAVDGGFAAHVRRARDAGRLVVQPRMGMSDPATMRAGLAAVRAADATTVGTITVDSFTRVGQLVAARQAIDDGTALNGYPIVSHDQATTAGVLAGIGGPGFPVQVRHGSAQPSDIMAASVRAGLDATEGGPISYCLPYGRVPLATSIASWWEASRVFARLRERGAEPHLETFGGCMLGQLCPPSQLVAISLLEGLFFARAGVPSVSLSYAQQTHPGQDEEAVHALRRLGQEHLSGVDWHIVVYAYMGVYPTSVDGATALLRNAVELAVRTGAERLIVKTVAEAVRIPTIEENVSALEFAARVAAGVRRVDPGPVDTQTHLEAKALVDAVLDLAPELDQALLMAFRRGLLDIPYCLHPDNRGRTRTVVDGAGRLQWGALGALPISHLVDTAEMRGMGSQELLGALNFVRQSYDGAR